MAALQWTAVLKVDLLVNPRQHLVSENEIGETIFSINPINHLLNLVQLDMFSGRHIFSTSATSTNVFKN